MKNVRTETWIERYWRPVVAWHYIIICSFDFFLAPIMTMMYSYYTSTPLIIWAPLTLQSGSMYHISMGAVLGVTSWTRGSEKIAMVDVIKQQQEFDNQEITDENMEPEIEETPKRKSKNGS